MLKTPRSRLYPFLLHPPISSACFRGLLYTAQNRSYTPQNAAGNPQNQSYNAQNSALAPVPLLVTPASKLGILPVTSVHCSKPIVHRSKLDVRTSKTEKRESPLPFTQLPITFNQFCRRKTQ